MGFLFRRTITPTPPYDTLAAEQRYALYFQLEYLTKKGVPWHEKSWAFQYLEKAALFFGMTKKQIEELRPFYNSYDVIAAYIKQIKNRQILEYMISNCSNIFVLMDGGESQKELGEQARSLYEELGFSAIEVRQIENKYMYRTEI